jgi:hypothetical protein
MTAAESDVAGTVATVWRYPVKSMRGEELNAVDITVRGLTGDRSLRRDRCRDRQNRQCETSEKMGTIVRLPRQAEAEPHGRSLLRLCR